MFDKLHELEFPLIHWVQSFRTPLLDKFFILVNFVDTGYFLMALFPAVWLGLHWLSGARIFYLFSFSGIVNYTFKAFFDEPRPFMLEPGLNIVPMKSTYGFPSGGAQIAMIMTCLIIATFRTTWSWILGIIVFFLLSLSRIYLGVHFPSDLVGGWLIGGILIFLYYNLFPLIEKALVKLTLPMRFFLSQFFPLLIIGFAFVFNAKLPMLLSLSALTVGFGLCLSAWQNSFLPASDSFLQGVQRATLGIVVIYGIYFSPIPSLVQPLLAGFWLSYLSSQLISFLERKKNYCPK